MANIIWRNKKVSNVGNGTVVFIPLELQEIFSPGTFINMEWDGERIIITKSGEEK